MIAARMWETGISGRARVAAVFATTLLTGLVALSLQATPALATSEGCTYTNFPNKYVCFGIVGKWYMASNYVDHFYVRRGKLTSDNSICNYRARVTVRSPSGYVWTYWSPTRWGCDVYRTSRSFYVRRHYPKGSLACGTWYENGTYIDKACNYIR